MNKLLKWETLPYPYLMSRKKEVSSNKSEGSVVVSVNNTFGIIYKVACTSMWQ